MQTVHAEFIQMVADGTRIAVLVLHVYFSVSTDGSGLSGWPVERLISYSPVLVPVCRLRIFFVPWYLTQRPRSGRLLMYPRHTRLELRACTWWWQGMGDLVS